jgi:hypothetical protein
MHKNNFNVGAPRGDRADVCRVGRLSVKGLTPGCRRFRRED